MKLDPSLWAIDITMPPIRFSSRHRVPQLDLKTYRCVLKRYLILKIVTDSEHYLFIMHSITLAIVVGLSLISSYVSFFPFLSPVNSFLHIFATFCSLQHSEHYFIMHSIFWHLLLDSLSLITWQGGGGGWLITSYVSFFSFLSPNSFLHLFVPFCSSSSLLIGWFMQSLICIFSCISFFSVLSLSLWDFCGSIGVCWSGKRLGLVCTLVRKGLHIQYITGVSLSLGDLSLTLSLHVYMYFWV